MSDREEISRDEIISIENSVISYLGNARLHFDNGDYLRALSFLDLAKNEIEYLGNHNAAQQGVQEDGVYCECNQNEAPYKIGSNICAVCRKPRRR